jgi:hypothetical protein
MLAAEGEHLDNALRIAAVIENPPEPDEEIDRDQLTRELRDILLWAYIEWRTTAGDTPTEALRTLKRHLSDTVCGTLLADTAPLAQLGQAA